jgi:LPS sulfotransferase NodH
MIAGLIILAACGWGLAILMWILSAGQEDRAWREAKRAAKVEAQRDRYVRLYHDAVRVNAAMLEHIGDERRAAAYQALADSPAFFDTAARRSLDWLDTETKWSE